MEEAPKTPIENAASKVHDTTSDSKPVAIPLINSTFRTGCRVGTSCYDCRCIGSRKILCGGLYVIDLAVALVLLLAATALLTVVASFVTKKGDTLFPRQGNSERAFDPR